MQYVFCGMHRELRPISFERRVGWKESKLDATRRQSKGLTEPIVEEAIRQRSRLGSMAPGRFNNHRLLTSLAFIFE